MWESLYFSEVKHYVCLFFQTLGKKNKLRVYYLSWLRNKILRNDPEVEKRQGWVSVGDLEGCVHYKVGKDFCFCLEELLNHPFASRDTSIFLQLWFRIVLGWVSLSSFKPPCFTWQMLCFLSFQVASLLAAVTGWCYGYSPWRLEEGGASPGLLLSQWLRSSVVT